MAKLSKLRRAAALKYLQECWQPHSGQKTVGDAIFNSPADILYVECGRKWGKSEFATYCCWLYAILNDNAEVYYLAPQVDQVEELVWANYRMQSCCTYDGEFLTKMGRILGGEIKVLNQKHRIILPNQSFIKCHGSDNVAAQRGLKPDFVACDEYRDARPEWLEAVRPNMAVKEGKLLFISTPPHGPNQAYELVEECKQGIKDGDPYYFYINQPSLTNDKLPTLPNFVEREKKRLVLAGKYNEFLREYMAQYIVSDENAIIPQLNRDILKCHKDVITSVHTKDEQVEYYCVLNPGNSTVFAASLYAVNRHSGEFYCLDELKIHDSNETSVKAVWPKVEEMITKITSLRDVNIIVNGEKPWFSRDLDDLWDISSTLTDKDCKKYDFNINLIKDIAMAKRLVVSEKCRELVRESETYQRNKKSMKIPMDETKLLLYNLRAALSACGYTTELLEKKLHYTKEDFMTNAELYIKKVTQHKTFDEVCNEIRLEQYGLMGDDDNLFGEDNDELI